MAKRKFTTHYGIDLTGRERDAHFKDLSWLARQAALGTGDTETLSRMAGFRRLFTFDEKIHTLAATPDGKAILIHAGKAIYRLRREEIPTLDRAGYEAARDKKPTEIAPALLALMIYCRAENGSYREITDFLPERPMTVKTVGDAVYFFDGAHLYCYESGTVRPIVPAGEMTVDGMTVDSVKEPYIPMLKRNGADFEARNLLTDLYRQRIDLTETAALREGNSPLIFERTADTADGIPTCRAIGCHEGDFGEVLVIPDTTVLDGVECAVTAIAHDAIKGHPFKTLVLSSAMHTLPAAPALDCPTVSLVRIPRGVTEFYYSFFNGCAESVVYEYEGNEEEWELVKVSAEGHTGTRTLRFGYSTVYRAYGIKLATETEEITRAEIGGINALRAGAPVRAYPLGTEGIYTHLLITVKGESLRGKPLTVTARATPFRYIAEEGTHALAVRGKQPTGRELLFASTVIESYDHRLFFGGNTLVPDVLFWSHEDAEGNPNPTYVGIYNYATDGDRMPIKGLYSASGELCVTHASGLGAKLVTRTYALPAEGDTALVRIYPLKGVYSLDSLHGGTVYGGMLHLLTSRGLCRYTRAESGDYLTARSVSERIAPLLTDCLRRGVTPRFSRLAGMLAMQFDCDLYLADTRRTTTLDGRRQYEWYPLRGVGSYAEDTVGYRAMRENPYGEPLYRMDGKNVFNEVALRTSTDGRVYSVWEVEERTLYRRENGAYSPVTVMMPTGEDLLLERTHDRAGGALEAPTALLPLGDNLLFGTAEGALLCFNLDIDPGAYGEEYYHTDGHPATALFETFAFDEGESGRRKRTDGEGVTLTLRHLDESAPTLTVSLDGHERRERIPASLFSFDRLDFDSFGFGVGEIAHHRFTEARDYFEKSYRLESAGGFALEGISYGYRVL